MTLGQKLYEVPSPCGLTCEYGLLERPCWAERSKLQAGSPEMAIEESQALSVGLCSCVDLTLSTERGIILSPVRYSHAGKGSTFRQTLWPLPLQRLQPISAVQHAGPEAAGRQELVVGWASFGSRTLWGVGDDRASSQPSPTPAPTPSLLTLYFISLGQTACLFLSIARSRSVMTGEQMAAFHPPTTPNPLERPIKMGWLKKQRSIVKNWQQRYFVLRAQQLYYYKDEEDSKPQVPAGCVSLPQAQSTHRGLLQAGTHWLLSLL